MFLCRYFFLEKCAGHDKNSKWRIYPRWLPDEILYLGFVEKHCENGGKSLNIITHVLYKPYDQKKMT